MFGTINCTNSLYVLLLPLACSRLPACSLARSLTLCTRQWRVDVQSKAKKIDQDLNEPCAVVELNLSNGAQANANSAKRAVRFEMTAAQVTEVASQLADIETLLANA